MKTRLVVALLLLPVCGVAQQQNRQLVFAFVGVTSLHEEIGQAEIRVLENRLTTALVGIAEAQGYSIIIPRNRDIIRSLITGLDATEQSPPGTQLAQLVAAHGVVAGEAHLIEERLFLDLQVIATESGETLFAHSSEYDSYNAALEAGRSAMYALFGFDLHSEPDRDLATIINGTSRHSAGELPLYHQSPSAELVSGRWSGDLGLEQVELFSDGRGLARIAGGHTMRLRFVLENSQVVVMQDEPNAPKLYLGSFPYSLAVQIVELARPMRWIFRLSLDGSRLIGSKETTSVRVEQGRVVGADNSFSRPAEWERLP